MAKTEINLLHEARVTRIRQDHTGGQAVIIEQTEVYLRGPEPTKELLELAQTAVGEELRRGS